MKQIFTMFISLFLTMPLHTEVGYTANITSEQTSDTVYIHINAYHSQDEIYNACEIELTYDDEMLRFDGESSTLGQSMYRNADGRLMLIDFGADKPLGESVYVLAFEVIGTGEATIDLYRAAFITSEKAATEDIESIVSNPDSITMFVRRE